MADIVVIKDPIIPIVLTSEVNEVDIEETDLPITISETDLPIIIRSPGPQGPPGADGSGSSFYFLHTQSTPSTSWTVNHNLGMKPGVDVLVGGLIVSGARVDHTGLNQLIITFNSPQSGEAVCS